MVPGQDQQLEPISNAQPGIRGHSTSAPSTCHTCAARQGQAAPSQRRSSWSTQCKGAQLLERLAAWLPQPSWYLVLTLKHAFRLFRQQYAIDPGKIKISILFCKASGQGYHFSIALEFYLDSPPPHLLSQSSRLTKSFPKNICFSIQPRGGAPQVTRLFL